MTSSESVTPQTIDRPPHPDANDHPLRHANKPRNINSTPISRHETKHLTTDVTESYKKKTKITKNLCRNPNILPKKP